MKPAYTYTAKEVRMHLLGLLEFGPFKTQRQLAETIGISAPFLSSILTGRRAPSGRVLTYLKLERVTLYKEKGR